MIKAILFDFHGVIVNDFTKRSEQDFCKKYKITTKIFNEVQRSIKGMDTNFDAEQTFFGTLQYVSKQKLNNIGAFFEKADIKNIRFRKGILDLIEHLKKDYMVGIASNVSRGLGERLVKMQQFELFEKKYRFFSYQIGHAKPSKEFFIPIFKKLGLKPSEIVFIDDRKSNTNMAQKLGINGILYKNIQDLRKKLRTYKIKIR